MEALLLFVLLLLTGQQHDCAASDDGFSVEFIHRDSARSPFHNPKLSRYDRMLGAARRSLVYNSGAGGIEAEIVTRSFEYLMYINVGTPPTKVLAIADTGSDLTWVSCINKGNGGSNTVAASDGSSPSRPAVFDPRNSSTYDVVSCQSDACKPLSEASCDATSHCQYQYSYGDGSQTTGLLSTETFSFRDTRGGQLPVRVPNVRFGCSTYSVGTFRSDGLAGLGGGTLSLATQLGSTTSVGRRFSYCLVPYANPNASSALNFGTKAIVSDPGAATTPLVASEMPAYYTVDLESVALDGKTLANKTSRIIVDSGTTLTFLDPELLQPLVSELEQRIKLKRTQSPEQLMQVCYDVSGQQQDPAALGIPDVTLQFGGGAAVTLRPVNTFVMVEERTLCLALVPVSSMFPVSILGNVAQQDFHVGYDLDARTVTFAHADCAKLAP